MIDRLLSTCLPVLCLPVFAFAGQARSETTPPVVAAFWQDFSAAARVGVTYRSDVSTTLTVEDLPKVAAQATSACLLDDAPGALRAEQEAPESASHAEMEQWFLTQLSNHVGHALTSGWITLRLSSGPRNFRTFTIHDGTQVLYDTAAVVLAVRSRMADGQATPRDATNWNVAVDLENIFGGTVVRVHYLGAASLDVSPLSLPAPGASLNINVVLSFNSYCENVIPFGCSINQVQSYSVPGYRQGGLQDRFCPAGGTFQSFLFLSTANFDPAQTMQLRFRDARTSDGGQRCWDLAASRDGYSFPYQACADGDQSGVRYMDLSAEATDEGGVRRIAINDYLMCANNLRGTFAPGGTMRLSGQVRDGNRPGPEGRVNFNTPIYFSGTGLLNNIDHWVYDLIFINLTVIYDRCGAGAPSITSQPSSITVCAGSSVELSIVAGGTPPLEFQWRRDGVGIPGATAASFQIGAADPADTASYDVEVTTACGSVISDAATLVVWPIGTGDVNGDGAVNGQDIEGILDVFLTPGVPGAPPTLETCAADLNGDGIVSIADIASLITTLVGL